MDNQEKKQDSGLIIGFATFALIIMMLVSIDRNTGPVNEEIKAGVDQGVQEVAILDAAPETLFPADPLTENAFDASITYEEIESKLYEIEELDFTLDVDRMMEEVEEEMEEVEEEMKEVRENIVLLKKDNDFPRIQPDSTKRYKQLERIYSIDEKWEPRIETCKMEDYGIQYMCDLNWKLDRKRDDDLIILSLEPIVTMSMGKVKEDINFLGQLNKLFFNDQNLYNDGFRTERVKFADRDAIMVKAFSKQSPDIRLSDYYYVYNGDVYSIKFSVFPKTRWREGQQILKEVVSSFSSI